MRETTFHVAVKRQTAAKEREARAEWLATFQAALTGILSNHAESIVGVDDDIARCERARIFADHMHGDVGPKP